MCVWERAARRANTQATGTKTKKNKGKALIKGVEQAENEKNKSQTEPNNQKQNSQQPPNQPPANTLATRTQQALDKKKRLAGKGTLSAVGTFGTVWLVVDLFKLTYLDQLLNNNTILYFFTYYIIVLDRMLILI